MMLLAVWGVLLALFLVIRIAAVQFTARTVGIPSARWPRAVAAVLAIFAWETASLSLLFFVPHVGNEWVMLAAVVTVQIAGAATLLRGFYGGADRGAKWPYLIVAYIAALFVPPMVILPPLSLVTESYVIPTQNMAPALSGPRVEAKCAECGRLVYFRVPNENERRFGADADSVSGYCLRCDKQYAVGSLANEIKAADRFSIEKLSEPRRWSVVAYHPPEEPGQTYVGRVIGMPGETNVLRDGFAYAGDQKLEPPAEIGEVRPSVDAFSDHPGASNPPSDQLPLWGDPAKPIKLADDEYFILGDNTKHSLDSRFFGAVKRDAIVGTASVIYWPPSRFRVFP